MPNDSEGALAPYLRALRAHLLIAVLALLATVAGGMAWITLRTPDYRASAEILVTPLPEGDETFIGIPFLVSSGDPTRTVQTAATLVSSDAAGDLTAKRLGGGITGSRVREVVAVKPKGESSVLDVEATWTDPRIARDMANFFAAAALELRSQQLRKQIVRSIERLEESLAETRAAGRPESIAELSTRITALENVRDGNDPTLSIAEPASLPRKPVGAPWWLILGLSIFAGSILAVGLAALLELLERRIRDEDELLSHYPLPVLTRVPLLSRRALRRSSKAMPPQIREAFRTLQAQLDVRGSGRRAVMLTSASRNDGKTSSAVNLALSLVAGGNAVILIDFDLRKPDIAQRLGIGPSEGLSALLDPQRNLADLLLPAPRLPLLQVVTAASTAGDVAMLEAMIRMMPRVLDEAAEIADYVIIDTAPLGEVSDALKLAEHADDVLIVTRPGHTNRVNLHQTRDLLQTISRPPTGYVVIGERKGASNAYYGYGEPAQRGSGRLSRLTTR